MALDILGDRQSGRTQNSQSVSNIVKTNSLGPVKADGDNSSDSEDKYDSEMDSMNMESEEDGFGNGTIGEDEDESESDDDDEDDAGDDDDDGMGMKVEDINHADMEELEKEYKDLQNKEQDLFRNIRRDQDDDILKGQAVKNQRALWDKTLEFRFLLQKSFSTSNQLPQEPVRSAFCNSSEEVKEAYSDLIDSTKKTLDSILKLQEILVEKNPSIMDAATEGIMLHDSTLTVGMVWLYYLDIKTKVFSLEEGDAARSSISLDAFRNSTEEDEEWFQISQMQSRIAPFRNISVDKWQRKTQVTSGAAGMKNKFQAFNQNISDQVASYMRDPSRMIKGMQQTRSVVPVFGDVSNKDKDEAMNADGDPELLDDSEFYQQLLREFFETVDAGSSETAFYALKRLQTKKRKIVDRRASKSRKIRYHVHEKIVNFMAPEPMNIPPMAPKLFENLFGLKTPKPASVVS
ncbi:putative apoptosis-antagonizing transcription factor, AATF leucine zipper-containing [Helianthus annuus]|nr:putative apoptosis-antagonizing transcription factor, AATF leucine zipper-containing [Helianthus annuus]KAJ0654751.1 putative apoptosis-antagonizing transcription factor, AATF leucine zipper-containing [Helianthus annuus]